MQRQVRILVVDDDELMQTVLSSICSSISGVHLVGVASDGAMAVEKFQLLSPDVVLLDVNMPTMSGLEALKKIREIDGTACVVMLTAVSTGDTVKECLTLGAQGYVLKTTPADAIRASIRDLCFKRLKKIVETKSAKIVGAT